MSSERTAWHPPFTNAMRQRGPRWTHVTSEVSLSQESQRADDMIELRADVPRDPADCGSVLRGLWPLIVTVGLLEFKSVSRPFRRGDLARLLAYGLVWFYTHQAHDALLVGGARRRATPTDLTLALVVPTLTPTLLNELADMALTLDRAESGYHRARNFFCAVVVIELERVAVAEHDELMGWFAGQTPDPSVELARWIGQNVTTMSAPDKASPDMEGFDDLFARFPLELRLRLLTPAERLAGLAPEDVAKALTEADHVLALPDAALRALPDAYLTTLPEAAQARIRARLGR
jgi:hypothetical protein